MTIRKEEIGALALAALAVGLIALSVNNVVIGGGEISSRGRSPWQFVAVGVLGLVVATYQYRKGSSGEPERNGRHQRPVVFWSAFFAFACFGLGFVFVGIFAGMR